MAVLSPIRSHYFVQWFHSRYFQAAANLECYSCENFWTVDDFRQVLTKGTSQGYILEDLMTPFGFIVFKNLGKQARILNLVVHPDYRRCGWGTTLIDRTKVNFESVAMDVRESNLGAHLFLKQNGFQATKVSKGYFKDVYEEHVEQEDGFRFVWKNGHRTTSL